MPGRRRKRAKNVYVPPKPWSSAERSEKILLPGGVGVPARFFELAYSARGPGVVFGKGKNKSEFSVNILDGLIKKKGISSSLEVLLLDIKRKKKIFFSEESVLSAIKSITRELNRKSLSEKEFSFLENLRLCLIDYKRDLFEK